MIEPQHQPKTPAHGRAHQPLPRGRSDGRERLERNRVGPRARPGADQNVEMEIFERRVEHLLNIGQQPVDLVDEKDLTVLNTAENAREVELLLQNRARSLCERDLEFLRNDRSKRRFPETRRTVQQHVIHRLAAFPRRVDCDLKILFETRLAGKVRQTPGTQPGLELALVLTADSRNQPVVTHRLPDQLQSLPKQRLEGIRSPSGAGFAHRRLSGRARTTEVEQR